VDIVPARHQITPIILIISIAVRGKGILLRQLYLGAFEERAPGKVEDVAGVAAAALLFGEAAEEEQFVGGDGYAAHLRAFIR